MKTITLTTLALCALASGCHIDDRGVFDDDDCGCSGEAGCAAEGSGV